MKTKVLFPLIISSLILSSCAVSVDLTQLTNEPKEPEEQEPSGEQEGQGEGGESTPEDNSAYQVDETYWAQNIFNFGMFSGKKFDVSCYAIYEGEEPGTPNFRVRVDDNKYHIIPAGSEKLYERISNTTARLYVKENDEWVLNDSNAEFDYKAYFEQKTILFPIAYSAVAFSSTSKAYEAATYLSASNKTYTNIRIKFHNQQWVSLEYDVQTIVNEQTYDVHVLNRISDWGNVNITLPEENA